VFQGKSAKAPKKSPAQGKLESRFSLSQPYFSTPDKHPNFTKLLQFIWEIMDFDVFFSGKYWVLIDFRLEFFGLLGP